MQALSRIVLGIITAVLSVGLVIFGVQNTEPVQIKFLNFSSNNISVSLVMIGSVIMGAVLIWLMGLWREARLSLRHRREAKERALLESKNKTLDARVKELERQLRTAGLLDANTDSQAATKKSTSRL
ncbi:MAG: LapA family protein [Chloroflexia bacterium]|nr:LapA family protein [Chloroflexia bacterium]